MTGIKFLLNLQEIDSIQIDKSMIEIIDINDPRIDYYRSLRYTPKSHTDDSVFVAEGLKVTEKLLMSDIPVISMFAAPEYYRKFNELIDKKSIPPDKQFTAGKKLMESIVGYNIHLGIMAIGRKPAAAPVEQLSSPIVVINNIIDSENVGSIIRNSAAFGIDSIIVDKGSSDPYLRRAVRVSMGNVFTMKIHYTGNLRQTLECLKNKMGYTIIAAEITKDSTSIYDYKFPDKFSLIFGSEGKGVSCEALDECDKVVHIPMTEGVNSINVAASSAVFLFQAGKIVRS